MPQTLTYAQWKSKHQSSPKYSNLSKTEWRLRYDSYLASMQAGRGPLVQYLPGTKSVKKNPPSRSGMTGKNKGKQNAISQANSMGFKLNPKTHDFLTARTNPFCPRIRDVGYPAPCVGGSLKWRAFVRGTLQTNAAGFGAILLIPGMTGWPDQLAVSASLSTNTQATDSLPPSAAPVGYTAYGMQGAPMTSAAAQALGPNSFVRLLGLGVRIRCDAPLLDKAGSIKTFSLPLIDQDAFTLTGNQIISTFPNYSQWYQANIADSPWFSSVWSPSFPNFTASPALIGQDTWQMEGGVMQINSIISAADQASCTMGILISGTGGVQSFDFEVYGFYEMFGQVVLGSTFATPTYSDPLGSSIVQGVTQTQSLNTMTKTATGAVEAGNVLSAVGDSIKTVLGKIDPMSVLNSVFGGTSTSATTITPTPQAGAELSGYAADAESLAARLAALQMPSVPGTVSSSSALSDAIPTAMEALAL
jgi:hypothetical protein